MFSGRIAQIVNSIARSLTRSGCKMVTYVATSCGAQRHYRRELPADLLRPIPALEAHGKAGISTEELASVWECSRSSARRLAERLVAQDWLSRHGKNAGFSTVDRGS